MKSSDDISDIIRYYQKNQENKRATNQQLEFRITVKIIEKYLPKKCRILELGSGVGFYTAHLAMRGHHVTAVEPVAEMVKISKEVMSQLNLSHQVEWETRDARDLDSLSLQFDVVLNMGPLYHLVNKSDRQKLIANSGLRLKENGLMMICILGRPGFLSYVLAHQPQFIEHPHLLDEIMNHGHYLNHPRDGSFRGYFSKIEEAEDLLSEFQLVAIHSQDPCIGGVDEIFNRLSEPMKEKWSQYLFSQSSEPDILSAGRSMMAIGKKKNQAQK